jgi:hypothetical protein
MANNDPNLIAAASALGYSSVEAMMAAQPKRGPSLVTDATPAPVPAVAAPLPIAIEKADMNEMSMWAERVARMRLEIRVAEQQVQSLDLLKRGLPQAKKELAEAEAKAQTTGQAMSAKYGLGPEDTFDTSTGAITRKPVDPTPPAGPPA